MEQYSEHSVESNAYKNQMNEQFQFLMSRLAHEVRNPLTLIYSSLQIIEQDCPDVQNSVFWPQLMQDVQDTISTLRELSSPDRSDHCSRHPLCPSTLLEKTASACRPFMKDHQICFTVDIPHTLPSISGNELRLKGTVINLLLNASDAISHNQGERCVLLYAAVEDSQLAIHVKDNGPGIPLAYRSTIFDPYQTHKAAGSGIGLSVVKTTALLHDGTISFTTSTQAPDSFTDFCLRLPIMQA